MLVWVSAIYTPTHTYSVATEGWFFIPLCRFTSQIRRKHLESQFSKMSKWGLHMPDIPQMDFQTTGEGNTGESTLEMRV